MNLLVKLSLVSIFFLSPNVGWAGTQQESVAIEQPPAKTTEPWQITVGGPGRLAGVSGTTGFHGTNLAINAASAQLVNQFAQSLTTPGSGLQTLIQQDIVEKLTSLNGNNPTLPVAPIADTEPGKIREVVQQVIQSQEPELAAAIRADAEARVDQLKAQLTNQVAGRVTGQLNRSFSFYDDWFDSLIALRGRFNLSKAFYLTAESDVGGSESDPTSLCKLTAHWAAKSPGTSFLKLVTAICTMTSAIPISSISYHCMERRSRSGSNSRNREL
jgi:hypothetical protein